MQRRSSSVQLIRSCCCCCIIISITLATVASSASTAKEKRSLVEQGDRATAEDKNAASNVIEPQPHLSPYDDTSDLAMLPKMKEQTDDVPEDYEDYYSVEFAEPQMDDVDIELLQRFLKMMEGQSRSDNRHDLLQELDDTAQSQNTSSDDESAPEKEPEMASSGHERDRRSADDHVEMTAEHMMPGGDAVDVNRPSRLKRDLNDYLYRRRWNSPDDYESPVAEEKFEENAIDPESSYTEDYDEENPPLSAARLRRIIQLQRAFDELSDRTAPAAYVPVIYRGVKGIFVPESSVGPYQAAVDWRRSSSVSMGDVRSAADDWSALVRDEVKKALDEYDLVYRLADALKNRDV